MTKHDYKNPNLMGAKVVIMNVSFFSLYAQYLNTVEGICPIAPKFTALMRLGVV